MPGVTAMDYISADPDDSPFWTYQPTAYRYRAEQEPCERCWLGEGRVTFHPRGECAANHD